MRGIRFSQKYMVLGLVMVILTIWLPVPVVACSGGPPPWDEYLPMILSDADVVVVGQYDILDDANTNGVFRVQTYLKGSGAGYLVVNTLAVEYVENNRHVERYYNMCGIDSDTLSTSGTYIYFLKRQDTGVYRISHKRYFTVAVATVSLSQPNYEVVEVDSAALSTQISEVVGIAPQKPNADFSYPRITPILLTTDHNKSFLLPVDSTILVKIADDELANLRQDQHECSTAPCSAFSTNGLDKVYLQPEGSELHESELDFPYIENNAFGERLVFSPTSETYAVWTGNQIQLYVLWYPKLGYPDQKFDSFYTAELFNTTAAKDSVQYPVAWSPDGRTIAFSTAEGLWLWDALTVDYPPQLLLAAQDSSIPVARYFSPRGRYLAIEDGEQRYNLDLVTRRELPDGYLSPNDRILLVFDTAAQEPTTLEVMYLAPDKRQFEYYPIVKYLDVQWIDDTSFQASISGFSYLRYKDPKPFEENGEVFIEVTPYVVEEPFYDTVQYDASGGVSRVYEGEVPYAVRDIQVRDFTYKNGPGLIEISVDGYSIYVNGALVSLDTELSSPIKEAIWLPSPFYYEDRYPVP